MNTQISSKLVALCAALILNSAMLGGIAMVFDSQAQTQPTTMLAQVGV